jgi:hypothetical protein
MPLLPVPVNKYPIELFAPLFGSGHVEAGVCYSPPSFATHE